MIYVLKDKMMREAQIKARMNTETILSIVLCERCLINRATLSLMINERYAISSVILSEDIYTSILHTLSCLTADRHSVSIDF